LPWLRTSAICLKLPFALGAHVVVIFPVSSSSLARRMPGRDAS
jgi:hypothetical protein